MKYLITIYEKMLWEKKKTETKQKMILHDWKINWVRADSMVVASKNYFIWKDWLPRFFYWNCQLEGKTSFKWNITPIVYFSIFMRYNKNKCWKKDICPLEIELHIWCNIICDCWWLHKNESDLDDRIHVLLTYVMQHRRWMWVSILSD